MTDKEIAKRAIRLNERLIEDNEEDGFTMLDALAVVTALHLAMLKKLQSGNSANVFYKFIIHEEEQIAFLRHLEVTISNQLKRQNNEQRI
jgi:hypothetical protein